MWSDNFESRSLFQKDLLCLELHDHLELGIVEEMVLIMNAGLFQPC